MKFLQNVRGAEGDDVHVENAVVSDFVGLGSIRRGIKERLAGRSRDITGAGHRLLKRRESKKRIRSQRRNAGKRMPT